MSSQVAEIRSNVKPAQWKHIPSDHNVADDISRGLPVSNLSGRCLNGPEFLKAPKNKWPKDTKPDPAEVDRECKKETFIGAVTTRAASTESVIKCENYSSWRKLVRVSAWVLKFKKRLLVKIRRASKEDSAHQDSLTPNELEESKNFWIKESQKCLKDRMIRNEFRTLSPFVDSAGIIRFLTRHDIRQEISERY